MTGNRPGWDDWLPFADVRRSHECWPARASTTARYSDGYRKYEGEPVHRLSFKLFYGRDADTVDHLCEIKTCCNPYHYEDTTHGQNAGRTVQRRRDEFHCPKGHEWTAKNTYYRPSGSRVCRSCRTEGMRKNATVVR